ncbi:sugar/sodium symporter [Streptococcus pyogenes]|nr:sugar/sodium symporter [Streptococcus pyogenes]
MEKTIDQRVEEVTYNRAKVWQLVLFALNNTSTNIYLFAFMFITYFSTGVLGLAAIFVTKSWVIFVSLMVLLTQLSVS